MCSGVCPRRVHRLELDLPDREARAVRERRVIVATVRRPLVAPVRTALIGEMETDPEAVGELPRARQEVGVDVGLGHGHDPEFLAPREIDVSVDVPLRVEEDRVPPYAGTRSGTRTARVSR